MHYTFGIQWLKAFRHSPEAVCALYGPGDDFIFEDPMLDQHQINNQADLHRVFGPYANKDRSNGIGIHNFRIRSYTGNAQFGLLRWEWGPEDAAVFMGLDVKNKPFMTQGHTFHQYQNGYIKRESSWWDSAAILRAVGTANPTKIITGKAHQGSARSEQVKLSGATPGSLAFAQDWCNALGRDTHTLRALYASRFAIEWGLIDDHERDTLTDTQMMIEQLGGIAAADNGRYTFTATEYLGDERMGLIHWNVTIEGATSYRGIPTHGKTINTIGSTFLEFDTQGKIVWESSRWEDNRAFQALGLPLVLPHYWEEGFDPSSLL
ncbi:hypothetical protein [Sinimarinibacterium sp. NLF-5-8]|uniref:hypothetical protein n=1 Tax=Sinimarinibacterium sp. NLF-5-8 TaxID=2698684 RepID=UPI00137BF299|nr:hypothetical protein [Sinimarinibacterium sp. NLF-5-8]QHS10294.1 hypothetical protein GT972_09200 [Sinimarinibacterium sp. NLF-5-8]